MEVARTDALAIVVSRITEVGTEKHEDDERAKMFQVRGRGHNALSNRKLSDNNIVTRSACKKDT